MKKFINNIKADRLTFRGFILSFFLIIATTLYILINYRNLPPLIPIFNQLPWGFQRLTQTWGIFIPVAILGILFIFNIIFTSIVYAKNPLIARIVAATTLLLVVMNFIFVVRTILVIL
jgi:hypothetical protein